MKRYGVTSRASVVLAGLLLTGLAGCPSAPGSRGRGDVPPSRPPAGPEGIEPAKIDVASTAFEPGGPIPARHTADGEDVSPPLSWSGVPEGTKELALVCDDPDAPRKEPWVHWVIYKIPADCSGLPEGLPDTPQLEDPPGVLQGKNSWTRGQTIGYRGPDPPGGKHRYFFKLYALDTQLAVGPGADKATLLEAMSGHVIGQGELMGTYER